MGGEISKPLGSDQECDYDNDGFLFEERRNLYLEKIKRGDLVAYDDNAVPANKQFVTCMTIDGVKRYYYADISTDPTKTAFGRLVGARAVISNYLNKVRTKAQQVVIDKTIPLILENTKHLKNVSAELIAVGINALLKYIDEASDEVLASKSAEAAATAAVAVALGAAGTTIGNPEIAVLAPAIVHPLWLAITQAKAIFKSARNPHLISGSGQHYYKYQRKVAGKKGGVEPDDGEPMSGSCDACMYAGGADETNTDLVIDYVGSVKSKTKEKIIEDIIKFGESIMGKEFPGTNSKSKISSFINALPKPSAVKDDDVSIRKTCVGVAKHINAVYGTDIIDINLPPHKICQYIIEILSSLDAGVYSEFLTVYNDVGKVVRNLQLLKTSLEQTIEDTLAQIEKMGGSKGDLQPNLELLQLTMKEIDRQLALLRNLFNLTLEPAEKELAKLLKDKKGLNDYIQSVGEDETSNAFGKIFTFVLRGHPITANIVLTIQNALNQVGITSAEYVNSKSTKDFLNALGDKMRSQDWTNGEKAEQYVRAMDLLVRYLPRVDELADRLKTGQGEHHSLPKHGGLGANNTNLENQAKSKTKVRDLIFRTFQSKINEQFRLFTTKLQVLADKIGSSDVPISEQLDALRQSLARMGDDMLAKNHVYFALTGYFTDAHSRNKKDEYIKRVNAVIGALDSMIESPAYKNAVAYLAACKEHLRSILDIINQTTTDFSAKFGSNERPEEVVGSFAYKKRSAKHKKGADELPDNIADEFDASDFAEVDGAHEDDDYMGGIETDLSGNMDYRGAKAVVDSIRQFDSRYRKAQQLRNLRNASQELSDYAKNYDELTAKSIAGTVQEKERIYVRLKEILRDLKPANEADGKAFYVNVVGFKDGQRVVGTTFEEEKRAADEFLDMQYKALRGFYNTLEAVDKLMQQFTVGVVSNPEDIRDIRLILDELEVITDYYELKTGPILSAVFDCFPSDMTGATIMNTADAIKLAERSAGSRIVNPAQSYLKRDTEAHYYKIIENAASLDANTATPGNPNIVATPSAGLESRKELKKLFTTLTLLKQLFNVAYHIGTKFGGSDIWATVKMTPAQMHSNIVEYLVASAYAQGFGYKATPDMKEDAPGFGTNRHDFLRWNETAQQFDGTRDTFAGSFRDETGVSNFTSFRPNGTVEKTSRIGVSIDIIAGKGNEGSHVYAKGSSTALRKQYGPWFRTSRMHRLYGQSFQKMSAVTKGTGSDEFAFADEFEGFGFSKEDDYFVHMIKALSSKVLTTLGMCDLIERPFEYKGIRPIRMILGGADEVPSVDEKALFIYFRIPWMVQFYKELFSFDDKSTYAEYNDGTEDGTKRIKIAMIPDLDGTFGGIISKIFLRNSASLDNMSDAFVKELLIECNNIYQKAQAKHSNDVNINVVYDLINEVGRRYGIITEKMFDQFAEAEGRQYEYGKYTRGYDNGDEASIGQYAILKGEDEFEVQKLSNHERLLGLTDLSSDKGKILKHRIHPLHAKLLKDFRCKLDGYFREEPSGFSFDSAIKQAEARLKVAKDANERFNIVANMMRGTEIRKDTDDMKCVMFHELVVAGLNELSAIHTLLEKFRRRCYMLDVNRVIEHVCDAIANTQNGQPIRLELLDVIGDKISAEFQGPCSAETMAWLYAMFGYGEGVIPNGGQVPAAGDINDPVMFCVKQTDKLASHDFLRWGSGTIANNGTIDGANNGIFKAIKGIPKSDLLSHYTSKTDSKECWGAKTFFKFLFGREAIMKELLETVYAFNAESQGLIDIKMKTTNDGKSTIFNISYGLLQEKIDALFEHIGYFLDVLRPHISPEVLDNYTNKLKHGSFYWLQEQINERIFIGRNRIKTANAHTYANLDKCIDKLNNAFNFLTQEGPDGAFLGTTTSATSPLSRTKSTTSYATILSEMIFYDASKPMSGILVTTETTPSAKVYDHPSSISDDLYGSCVGGSRLADLKSVGCESLFVSGCGTAKIIDTRFIMRMAHLYNFKDVDFTHNRSCLFDFNQLIAKYIDSFYDPLNSKIYGTLLQSFNNSEFSKSIEDHKKTYPDVIPLWYIRKGGLVQTKKGPLDAVAMIADPVIETHKESDKFLAEQLGEVIKFIADASDPNYNPFQTGGGLGAKIDYINSVNAPRSLTMAPPIIHIIAAFLAKLISESLNGVNNGVTPASPNPPLGLEMFIRLAAGLVNGASAATANGPGGVAAVTVGDVKTDMGNEPLEIYNAILHGAKSNNRSSGATNANLSRLGLIFNLVNSNNINSLRNDGTQAHSLGATFGNNFGQPPFRGSYFGVNLVKFTDLILGLTPSMTIVDSTAQTPAAGFAYNTIAPIYPLGKDNATLSNPKNAEVFAKTILSLLYNRSIDQRRELSRAFAEAGKGVIGVREVNSTDVTYSLKLEDLSKFDIDTSVMFDHTPDMVDDKLYFLVARSESVAGLKPGNIAEMGGNDYSTPNAAISSNALRAGNFCRRWDPDGDHVLATSLAYMIKNIFASRTSQNASVHLIDNVSEVSATMKEKMRANLPIFKCMFSELSKRCEFIRTVLNSNVNLDRVFNSRLRQLNPDTYDIDNVGGLSVPNHNPWPFVLLNPVGQLSADAKIRFASILGSIQKGCAAFANGIDMTLKEIGDSHPLFMETHQQSLKEYKTQYNTDPVTPLSSLLAITRNTTWQNANNFTPAKNVGSFEFKWAYGTRGVLHNNKKFALEDAPGFVSLVDNYNSIADAKTQLDKKKIASYAEIFVELSRFIYTTKHIRGLLSSHLGWSSIPVDEDKNYTCLTPNIMLHQNTSLNYAFKSGFFAKDDMILSDLTKDGSKRNVGFDKANSIPSTWNHKNFAHNSHIIPITNKSEVSLVCESDEYRTVRKQSKDIGNVVIKPVIAVCDSIADLANLVESITKDREIARIAKQICGDDGIDVRNFAVQNFIDLNVVPLSVHALQKSIPLANLYNQSYTFERFIVELLYGLKFSKSNPNENTYAATLMNNLCEQEGRSSKHPSQIPNIKSAKDALLAMILNPYVKIDMKSYNTHIKNMVLGEPLNGELGRPKFASDLLYGSTMFGQLYRNAEEKASTGPAANANNDVLESEKRVLVNLVETILRFIAGSRNTRYGTFISDVESKLNTCVQHLIDLAYRGASLSEMVNKIAPYENTQFSPFVSPISGYVIAGIITLFVFELRKKLTSSEVEEAAVELYTGLYTMSCMSTVQRQLAPQSFLGVAAPYVRPGANMNQLVANVKEMQAAFESLLPTPGDSLIVKMNIWTNVATHPVDVIPTDILRIIPMSQDGYDSIIRAISKINYTNTLLPSGRGNSPLGLPTKYDAFATIIARYTKARTGNASFTFGPGSLNIFPAPSTLTYFEPNREDEDDTKILSANVAPIAEKLAIIGKARFDSILIRNLFFLDNTYRCLMLAIRRALNYNKDLIIDGIPASRYETTEFRRNQAMTARPPYGKLDMEKKYSGI